MKKIVLILLIVLTDSCTHIQVERCMIDTVHNNCYCHQYVIERGNVGRVSETETKPIDYCDKFISFSPDDWALLYATFARYFIHDN